MSAPVKIPQKHRYSDKEFNTLKLTFADNEHLLRALRKHFLQMALSEKEQTMLKKAFTRNGVWDVVVKTFLPELDGEAPFGQIVDLWLTLKIDDKDPEKAVLFMKARDILIRYTSEQLASLKGEVGDGRIILSKLGYSPTKSELDAYVELMARNAIISHTEQMIFQLKVLAGTKTETVEETLARLSKDSSR